MNLVTVQRGVERPGGTPGYLRANDLELFTLERRWHQNRRRESCIPPGIYDLEWHGSEKYQVSWALVGKGITHQKDPTADRDVILAHRANWAHQLLGCLAVGMTHTYLIDEGLGDGVPRFAVGNSGKALRLLKDVIGDGDGWHIEILAPPGWAGVP